MRLRNSTDIPNELVRKIVNFVRPSGISKFDVMLRNSSCAFAGRSYHGGSGYHMSADPFIVLRIGSAKAFPSFNKPPRPGYLGAGWLFNRIEALVFLTAHELRHQWQYKVKRGRRVWGARGQFSERDADAYGIKMLRAWRRSQAQTLAGANI